MADPLLFEPLGMRLQRPIYYECALLPEDNGEVFKEATESFAEKKSQHLDISQPMLHLYQITTELARGMMLTFFPSGAHLGGTEAATSCGEDMGKKQKRQNMPP